MKQDLTETDSEEARLYAERRESDRIRKARARELERLRKGTLRESFMQKGGGRPEHMDFPHWVPVPMRPEYEDRARQWGEEHAAAWARKEKRLLMYCGDVRKHDASLRAVREARR